MKTRIIAAAVIIPVALVILLVLPPYALTITLAVISAIGAYELINAVNQTCNDDKGKPSPRVAVYAIIAAVMVPFVMHIYFAFAFPMYVGLLVVFFILLCLLMIDFFLSFTRSRPGTLKPGSHNGIPEKRMRLRQLLVVPAAALLIPCMISCLLGLRMLEPGRWLVMLPIVVTVLTDSGAYFTGVTIGKHKPLPKISPNKTVEGFIGGIVAGMASLLVFGLVMNAATEYAVSYPILLLYGLLGAVITEIGDLAYSLIKRKCGIKDYGNLIPGHGGVLDRFDSMTFSAPMMLLLVTILPALG